MHIPTFQDVLHAQRQIRPYLKITPTYSYSSFNALIWTEVCINSYTSDL
jgi:hypothetical protein